jgi:hypothetical protein
MAMVRMKFGGPMIRSNHIKLKSGWKKKGKWSSQIMKDINQDTIKKVNGQAKSC